jgi:hypothetical protein
MVKNNLKLSKPNCRAGHKTTAIVVKALKTLRFKIFIQTGTATDYRMDSTKQYIEH